MSKIVFALDVPDYNEANKLIQLLEPHVGAFKIGLEYFISNRNIPKTDRPIVLDLKLHDIPETVCRAVQAACQFSVKYITLHIQQQETMQRAVEIANKHDVMLLGVTVLSSMGWQDLNQVDGMTGNERIVDKVLKRTRLGFDCGLQGFVCSPLELKTMRGYYPNSFLLVPGVRPAGSSSGDQKRISTPKQTISDGASMIVIGRPIRDAKNPVEAAQKINQEIEGNK